MPKVARGTGSQIADAVFSVVSDWQLRDKIVALGFDTPNVNAGLKNGVNVFLERKMGKKLLWLACRHHALEVVCRDVFNAVLGSTDSPNVTLFKEFKNFWPNIDQKDYKPCQYVRVNGILKDLKEQTIHFVKGKLTATKEKLPRDDYREFLELTLLFLGEIPPRGVHIQRPGAFHHARWMSKIL